MYGFRPPPVHRHSDDDNESDPESYRVGFETEGSSSDGSSRAAAAAAAVTATTKQKSNLLLATTTTTATATNLLILRFQFTKISCLATRKVRFLSQAENSKSNF